MKKALLLINGKPPKDKININKYDAIYCTDGAYQKALEIGLRPEVVVGDFDSIELSSVEGVEVVHRPDQDYTDFDKCLKVLSERAYQSIDVYGATGLEHDHFLGNLTTAVKYKEKLRISFHDDFSVFFFTQKEIRLKEVYNRMISLYPFPEAKNVCSEGLFYHLKNMDLSILQRVGTRNHAVENEVKITYTSGNLLVFVSKYTRKKAAEQAV